MNKQKIITIIVVLLVVVFSVCLYVYGKVFKKEKINSPNAVNNELPILLNKEKILGNKEDLISFTILPDTKVHGILSYRGKIKGGYFFEGNILINILDLNKKALLKSNGIAKSDWMTEGPVDFEGNVDFTNLPKGQAYFEIKNDNPSDIRENDKSILIPIYIN